MSVTAYESGDKTVPAPSEQLLDVTNDATLLAQIDYLCAAATLRGAQEGQDDIQIDPKLALLPVVSNQAADSNELWSLYDTHVAEAKKRGLIPSTVSEAAPVEPAINVETQARLLGIYDPIASLAPLRRAAEATVIPLVIDYDVRLQAGYDLIKQAEAFDTTLRDDTTHVDYLYQSLVNDVCKLILTDPGNDAAILSALSAMDSRIAAMCEQGQQIDSYSASGFTTEQARLVQRMMVETYANQGAGFLAGVSQKLRQLTARSAALRDHILADSAAMAASDSQQRAAIQAAKETLARAEKETAERIAAQEIAIAGLLRLRYENGPRTAAESELQATLSRVLYGISLPTEQIVLVAEANPQTKEPSSPKQGHLELVPPLLTDETAANNPTTDLSGTESLDGEHEPDPEQTTELPERSVRDALASVSVGKVFDRFDMGVYRHANDIFEVEGGDTNDTPLLELLVNFQKILALYGGSEKSKDLKQRLFSKINKDGKQVSIAATLSLAQANEIVENYLADIWSAYKDYMNLKKPDVNDPNIARKHFAVSLSKDPELAKRLQLKQRAIYDLFGEPLVLAPTALQQETAV